MDSKPFVPKNVHKEKNDKPAKDEKKKDFSDMMK